MAQAIIELCGKRFHSVKALYWYARKNRRLRKAISALTEMIWRNRNRSKKARELVEKTGTKRRYGSGYS